MKQIKLAVIVNDMNINGISTVIMNYCERLDREEFHITVISGAPIDAAYYSRCEEAGIRLIELPPRKTSPAAYYRALWHALSEKYDIVHVHGNSSTMGLSLSIAKARHIPVRIAHSHNSTCGSMLRHRLLLPLFRRSYTHAFACSKLAGDWIFGEDNYTIINNGIDVEKFKFNEEMRREIRKELGVENDFVIGHIGRFNSQKNHPFLLKIFEQIASQKSDAYLLLVGNGPDYESVMELIRKHPYQNRIIVYGETSEIEKLYAAMDVFVFPSKYEGLGIVLVEAQVSGLQCVVSDAVPREVDLCNRVKFLPLDSGILNWSNEILLTESFERESVYLEHQEKLHKYSSDGNVIILAENYITFLVGTKKD